jgi:MoxR-like ATPase
MHIQLGYPDRESENSMLKTQLGDMQHEVKTVMDMAEFIKLQAAARHVHKSDELLNYILHLATFSQESNQFVNPLSPRATKALLSSAKAWALINNRDCLIPEDVQAILPAVAEHRLRSALGDFSTHGSLGWIMKTLQRYWNKWLNKRINAAIQHHLNHQKIFILPAKLLYFFVFVFTTYFAWY